MDRTATKQSEYVNRKEPKRIQAKSTPVKWWAMGPSNETYLDQQEREEASMQQLWSMMIACNKSFFRVILWGQTKAKFHDNMKYMNFYIVLKTLRIFPEFWLVFWLSISAAAFKSAFNLSISSLTSEGRKTWATLIVFASNRYSVTFLSVCTVKSDWFTTYFRVCIASPWNSSCPTDSSIHPILNEKQKLC